MRAAQDDSPDLLPSCCSKQPSGLHPQIKSNRFSPVLRPRAAAQRSIPLSSSARTERPISFTRPLPPAAEQQNPRKPPRAAERRALRLPPKRGPAVACGPPRPPPSGQTDGDGRVAEPLAAGAARARALACPPGPGPRASLFASAERSCAAVGGCGGRWCWASGSGRRWRLSGEPHTQYIQYI